MEASREQITDFMHFEAAYGVENPVSFNQLQQFGNIRQAQVSMNFNTWGIGAIDNNRPLDQTRPLRVIIHGFLNSGGNSDNHYRPEQWMADMAQALREREPDSNIIIVDWSDRAETINYTGACQDTSDEGEQLAEYLERVEADPGDTHIIGHSLGAQIASYTGEYYQVRTGKPIDHITGLDPAGPHFEGREPKVRLDPDDAIFVDVIHTSDTLGDFNQIGDVDFYPNHGHWFQPHSHSFIGNHGYAHQLYIRSIRGEYYASDDGVIMGYDAPRTARGSYDVDTRAAPYTHPAGTGKIVTRSENNVAAVFAIAEHVEQGPVIYGCFSGRPCNKPGFSERNPACSPLRSQVLRLLMRRLMMLTQAQVDFYRKHGYLRIPQIFTPAETDRLANDLDRLVEDWAFTSPGWTGPWRQAYMDPETEKQSKLTAMHDLHLYSEAWSAAVTHPALTATIADLIGPNVELHHSTLHIKPPQTGHPFPMHQDNPFYEHTNGRYIDVLVHLDDTSHANGEIRFLDGSHRLGALEHITMTESGPCTPHLPTDQYKLEETVPVPAQRGDVVVFNIYTIHGSYINTTKQPRRMVRVGYRDPENIQVAGQSLGRPGLLVRGYRVRQPGQPLLRQD